MAEFNARSQVPLTFDDQEFFVDLLFYHLNLRAFVVVELNKIQTGIYGIKFEQFCLDMFYSL